MSRIVVPVSVALATLLPGLLVLTLANVISTQVYAVIVTASLLVLWSVGDWRSQAERMAGAAPRAVRKNPVSRPGLGS